MTVTVHTGLEAHPYDQEGVTFAVEDGELTISVSEGTLAVYAEDAWERVTDDQYDAQAPPSTPPVASAPETTPVNDAPPEPTPVTESPEPVTTPETPEVPADTTVTPLTAPEAVDGASEDSGQSVTIPAQPGGFTAGSPAS